jgi:flagella basal body P-ring formation protein FlgA
MRLNAAKACRPRARLQVAPFLLPMSIMKKQRRIEWFRDLWLSAANFVPAVCLGLLALSPVQATSEGIHSLESIRATAEAFVLQQIGDDSGDVEARAGRLDPRVRLAQCDQALEAFNATGSRLGGNASIGVRCDGSRPWKIYVPVKVSREAEVAVLAKSLSRGATLTEDVIRTQRMDTTTLSFGYYSDVGRLSGQTLRRAAAAGTVITPDLVAIPPMVRKGEQVTLIAQRQGIAIRAPGRAMVDAQIGDLIQVRNLSSERVVEGRVRGPGEVVVHAP